jgi:hypothetical protein
MSRPYTLVPKEATVDEEGRRICGATKKRGGGRCQTRQVLSNGRCRMHGGNQKRGLASPNLKTGRYSQDLPTRVLARYEAALSDPSLLSLKDDIALVQAAIAQTLDEIKDAELRPDLDAILGTVEKISTEWQTWEWTKMQGEMEKLKELIVGRVSERQAMREVRELVREKARLIEQENRLLLDKEQMVSIEQYILAMQALGSAVRRLVDDPATLRAIDVEFRRIASTPDRERGN